MRFVLVDQLVELEPGKRAVARKTFDPGDEIFADHFPGFAVVPGVLITEAMGQTAGWLLVATLDFARFPLLTLIESAKFRRFVRPGEVIELSAVLREVRSDDFEVRVQARARGERVADARLWFHVFDAMIPDEAVDGFEGWMRRTFRELGGEELLARRLPGAGL